MDLKKLEESDILPSSRKMEAPFCWKMSIQKVNYRKISNQLRQKLIEMVYLKDYLLKDASRILGINYSTAKTILRIFRLEKRIDKKNDDVILKKMSKDAKEEDKNSFPQNGTKIENTLISSSEESELRTKEQCNLNMLLLFKKISESKNMVETCFNQIWLNDLMIYNIMKEFKYKMTDMMPYRSTHLCNDLSEDMNPWEIGSSKQPGTYQYLNN